MEYYTENSLGDIQTSSPDDIAEKLFSDVPQKECTYNLNLSENTNDMDAPFVFEILISILLEGMAILHDDFENCDLKQMNANTIKMVAPYMRSLCFDLNVEEFNNKLKLTTPFINDFYCKIILKCDKEYTTYFIKDLQKDFTFFFNPKYGKNYPKTRDLKEIYAILKVDDKTYKIFFDFIDLSTISQTPIDATKHSY